MSIDAFIAAREAEKVYMNTIYPLTISAALKEVSRTYMEVNKNEPSFISSRNK
jgi:hypothetical protein